MGSNNPRRIDWDTFDWNAINTYERVPIEAHAMRFTTDGRPLNVVPNDVRIRLYNEWNNRPETGEWDDSYPMELFPDQPLPPSSPPMDVPRGSEDAIMGADITEGVEMTDFDNERSFNRYYKSTTYAALNGKNPFTRLPIDRASIRKYSAHIVDTGAARRTRRKRGRKSKTKKQTSGKRIRKTKISKRH
jgi:hypothetical protein